MEINKSEYVWTEKQIIGMALIMIGGTIDSFGDQIKADIYYEVGKRVGDGMTAIIPTPRNQRHEFLNEVMKQQNKFN